MIFHRRDYQPQPRYSDLLNMSIGGTRYVGFHQTTAEAAVSIAHSEFRISQDHPSTMLGHGVYFARSIAATENKANSKGAIICAEIEMGRVRYVDIGQAHAGVYRGKNDWWEEYDTTYVCHSDDTCDEFCVRDPSQILQWVIVVEKDNDTKVEKYKLHEEFEGTWCGFV